MKYVYTDARFPGIEVVNEGNCTMKVYSNGKIRTEYKTWEKAGGTLSESFAAQRAADYFNLLEQSEEENLRKVPEKEFDAADKTDVFNNPPGKPNPELVDRMIVAAKNEKDPARKKRLIHNAMLLMRQEGTSAAKVVEQLLAM